VRWQASIIDSLDTLYLMGMEEEFQRARDWVASFNFILVPTFFLFLLCFPAIGLFDQQF
jgi:hypothetical protein